MTDVRVELYFAMVDLVRVAQDAVLEPDVAGAITHVAARAADPRTFLDSVAAAADELGLALNEVDWVATAHGLSRAQINSDYYHALLPQLEHQPVGGGGGDFHCYPPGGSDERDT